MIWITFGWFFLSRKWSGHSYFKMFWFLKIFSSFAYCMYPSFSSFFVNWQVVENYFSIFNILGTIILSGYLLLLSQHPILLLSQHVAYFNFYILNELTLIHSRSFSSAVQVWFIFHNFWLAGITFKFWDVRFFMVGTIYLCCCDMFLLITILIRYSVNKV